MHWLVANWRTALPSGWAEIAIALIATISGAVIGMERQKREKPAGLRTLILVCLGSATFTMASYLFNTASNDSGRVAAQIVTGVGFLGAGVILHGRGTISGTTTAATIWVTAAVGMIAGTGHAGGALGLSLLVRLILSGIIHYETRLAGGKRMVAVTLDFDPSAGRTRVRLERILVDFAIPSKDMQWDCPSPDQGRLTLRLHVAHRHLRELLDELVGVPAVLAIREGEN